MGLAKGSRLEPCCRASSPGLVEAEAPWCPCYCHKRLLLLCANTEGLLCVLTAGFSPRPAPRAAFLFQQLPCLGRLWPCSWGDWLTAGVEAAQGSRGILFSVWSPGEC